MELAKLVMETKFINWRPDKPKLKRNTNGFSKDNLGESTGGGVLGHSRSKKTSTQKSLCSIKLNALG